MVAAINDLTFAFKQWQLWSYLAWTEVRVRYKRSVLGPWWITLSMAITMSAMGLVYGRLFHQDLHDYLPFLIAGNILWLFISTSAMESSDTFKAARNIIKQIKLPFFTYILKQTVRNMIIFAHNFFVYVAIALIFHLHPGITALLAIPGFVLVVINMIWIQMLLCLIGTRFRDMAQIINSAVTILFFISPIAWMPHLLGEKSLIVRLNPISYFLDLVRSPLLGTPPHLNAWVFAIILALFGFLLTLSILAKYHQRIAFWIE